MVGDVYAAGGGGAVVFGRCLVEGNAGAHNSNTRGWQCAGGQACESSRSRAINSVAAAESGYNNTAELQGVLCRSSLDVAAAVANLATAVEPAFRVLPYCRLARLPPSKTQIFHASISSSLHRQHYKTLLTAALPSSMARAVFALRVEEIRPMAGRPTWINSF